VKGKGIHEKHSKCEKQGDLSTSNVKDKETHGNQLQKGLNYRHIHVVDPG